MIYWLCSHSSIIREVAVLSDSNATKRTLAQALKDLLRGPSPLKRSAWGALCGYLYRKRAFYARIFQVEGQNSFRRYFSEYLFCATESFFRPGDSLTAAEQENYRFFITFLRDAILATVIRWLTEGSRLPPEEFVSRLHYISDTIDTQERRKLSGEGTPCP